jgi:hypothetical protein
MIGQQFKRTANAEHLLAGSSGILFGDEIKEAL